MKLVKDHAYVNQTLTVAYDDGTMEKFFGVSDDEHAAFARSGFDKDGQPVPLTNEQQTALLNTLRAR